MMSEKSWLLSPSSFGQKVACGGVFGLLVWVPVGILEALIYKTAAGSLQGLHFFSFLVTIVLGYGAWGLLLGVLSSLVVAGVHPGHPRETQEARRETDFVPFLHGVTVGLLVLGYGLAWADLNAFQNLSPLRLPFLAGNLVVLGASALAGGVVWWVSVRLCRQPTLFWSTVVGLLTFLILVVGMGAGLVVGDSRGTSMGSILPWLLGLSLATLLTGLGFARITYLALVGREVQSTKSTPGRKWQVLTGALIVILLSGTAVFWLRGQGSGSPRPGPQGPKTVPNVLLISIDALRADHLSCYGYFRRTSPVIDGLASQGARFAWAISQAPFTPISVTSFLTGNTPPLAGVRDNYQIVPPQDLTLAEILRAHGYQTAAFVSNNILFKDWGYGQGFETYNKSARLRFNADQRSLLLFGIMAKILPPPRGSDALSTTNAVLRWLNQNHQERFFVWIHYMDPHSPYDPPPPYRTLYDPSYADQEHFARLSSQLNDIAGEVPEFSLRQYATERDMEHARALYDGEIRFADAQLERLLAQLERWGILEKTLIVITSDHGEALGEHDQLGHSYYLYDETQRVPLIFHYPPAIPSGVVIPGPVRLIDLVPTVLDIAGITPPAKVEGQSLLPHIRGERGADSLDAFAESRPHAQLVQGGLPGVAGKRRMLRTAEWKLIYTPRYGDPLWELYDLKKDPKETRNVYGENPEVAMDLKGRLEAWMWNSEGGGVPDHVGRIDQSVREELKALGYVP